MENSFGQGNLATDAEVLCIFMMAAGVIFAAWHLIVLLSSRTTLTAQEKGNRIVRIVGGSLLSLFSTIVLLSGHAV